MPKDIFESPAVYRHSLICHMNSDKLIDTFWSMTHHVLSIYMNTPLSVCGLKGVISLSTIILDDFTLLFIFILFLTVSSMANDQFNHIEQKNSVKWNISPQVLTLFSSCFNFNWLFLKFIQITFFVCLYYLGKAQISTGRGRLFEKWQWKWTNCLPQVVELWWGLDEWRNVKLLEYHLVFTTF